VNASALGFLATECARRGGVHRTTAGLQPASYITAQTASSDIGTLHTYAGRNQSRTANLGGQILNRALAVRHGSVSGYTKGCACRFGDFGTFSWHGINGALDLNRYRNRTAPRYAPQPLRQTVVAFGTQSRVRSSDVTAGWHSFGRRRQ